jgi:hypothetical protein
VEFRQADDGGGGGLLLLIVRSHAWFGVWLRVKSVTSVAEAYMTRPNKEKTGKVLYIYLAWRVDRWDKEVHI